MNSGLCSPSVSMADRTGDLCELAQRGYRFALSLTHDGNQAEDLVQEAWFSVLKANGPMKREYLFVAIRNRFIDRFRRDQRFSPQPLDEAEHGPAAEDDRHDDAALATSNGALGRALGRLGSKERAVLYLSTIEDFSAQQIGDLLQWPRGTVLSLVYRAKKKIRAWVEAESRSTP